MNGVAGALVLAAVAPSLGAAHRSAPPAAESALSLNQLFASPRVYDARPVLLQARLEPLYPEEAALVDEHCRAHCSSVVGYDVAAGVAQHPDMRAFNAVRLDNDHACYLRFRALVRYKPARAGLPAPPAGVRIRRLVIVQVLATSTRPFGDPGGRPCPPR